MNCNLKWQTAEERGTARNAKAIRRADARIPAPEERVSQTTRTSNARAAIVSSKLPEPIDPADAADDADMQDDGDDEEAGKSERRSKPDMNGDVMSTD